MKYIIEFEDEPCMYEDGMKFYKCIQGPWWGLSERVIKQLTPYQPDIAPDTNVGNITNSCAHEKDHNADIGKKAEKEDCISRQAVLEIAKSSKSNWIDNSVLFKRVGELPPVTQQPKIGKWIEHPWAEEENGLLISNWECNLCGTWERKQSDFCPSCGAKMEA